MSDKFSKPQSPPPSYFAPQHHTGHPFNPNATGYNVPGNSANGYYNAQPSAPYMNYPTPGQMPPQGYFQHPQANQNYYAAGQNGGSSGLGSSAMMGACAGLCAGLCCLDMCLF